MNAYRGLAVATVIAAATLMVAAPAVAQSETLRVAIPFDFWVTGKLLPAGTYKVSHIGNPHSALRLTDSSGRSYYTMVGNPVRKPSGATNQLVFRRYGETTFLAGIYWSGANEGREVPFSAVENRLAQAARAPAAVAVNAR
jgi:hypothetical protein